LVFAKKKDVFWILCGKLSLLFDDKKEAGLHSGFAAEHYQPKRYIIRLWLGKKTAISAGFARFDRF